MFRDVYVLLLSLCLLFLRRRQSRSRHMTLFEVHREVRWRSVLIFSLLLQWSIQSAS